MSFTDSPWVKVEAFIDGAWVDVTADTDDDDGGGRVSGAKAVTLKHGRSPGAQRANSRTADFDIFNRDGKYASRNPRSPYWGLLDLNTPCRVTALPYESYVALHSADLFSVPVYAEDSATLDITGDLEFRIDIEPEQSGVVYAYTTVCKWWPDGNNRSWLFIIYEGKPLIWWSPDGTFSNARFILGNGDIAAGRQSIKVQLDVNNGAGAVAASFYTADTIDGTYTQIGTTTTSAGTSSIFSGTARVTFTADHNGTVALQYPHSQKLQGKLYEFRLYSGINGSLVATADFTNLQPGDTSVSDGTTTWNIQSPGYEASDKIRFYGYIPKWPVVSATKTHRYSSIKATGLFDVLNQGALDLDSPMYRFYSTVPTLIGYWPGEDGRDASQMSASDTRTRPATTVDVTFAGQGDLPGSKDLPTITTTSKIKGSFKSYTNTGEWAFTFCAYLDATPVADIPIMYITTSNNMVVKFTIGTTTYLTQIYDVNGTLLSSQNTLYGSGAEPGQWLAFVFEFTQSGANIVWALNWRGVEPQVSYAHGATFAGTLGRLTGWTVPSVPSGTGVNTVSVGQIAGDSTVDVFLESPHILSFRGYISETDIDRLERLCGEEGISIIIKGGTDDGVPMGKQNIKTLVGLFDDCAAAGGGVLIETRFSNALMYITRRELSDYYTRDLDYAGGALLDAEIDNSIEPVNYVTITRDEGGSATAITTEGPRAVSRIGTYGEPQTLNLYEDSQTRDAAEWIRHIGSWDEDRWFGMRIELAKNVVASDSVLLNDIYGFDLLKGIRITNPPDYLPVREPECLIEEYTEVLSRPSHTLDISTSPARPYAIATWQDARVRIGSSETRVSTAINDSSTSLVVKSSSPYTKWEYSSSFYISVGNDKEKMLVTGISGTSSPWTFTVARGTPGFSHAVDDHVRLWDARVIGY